MSTQITVSLPDEVYEQIEQLARSSQRSVSEILVDTVTNALPVVSEEPGRAQMAREVAAYVAMHQALLADYAGAYVAIHKGELVDTDSDLYALLARRDAHFPDEVVLIRQVLPDPDPILHFRSPRIVRNGS